MSLCGSQPTALQEITSLHPEVVFTYAFTVNGFDCYWGDGPIFDPWGNGEPYDKYAVIRTYDCSLWQFGGYYSDPTTLTQYLNSVPPGDSIEVEDLWIPIEIHSGVLIERRSTTNLWKFIVGEVTHTMHAYYTLEHVKSEVDYWILNIPVECPEGQIMDPELGICVSPPPSNVGLFLGFGLLLGGAYLLKGKK